MGKRPVEHVPGSLRPLSATLAVVPIECGKHDTAASKWDKAPHAAGALGASGSTSGC